MSKNREKALETRIFRDAPGGKAISAPPLRYPAGEGYAGGNLSNGADDDWMRLFSEAIDVKHRIDSFE